MIDALLFAVRDTVQQAGFGWDQKTCDIMDDGHPPAGCGDWFSAISQAGSRNDKLNYLDEYFNYNVTVTRRLSGIPLDRIRKILTSNQIRTFAKEIGFNARCEQLRAFLHMNWAVIREANNNLVAWLPSSKPVYGFCEPAHYTGMEIPMLQGAEWLSAEPNEDGGPFAIKAEMRFEAARRLQAITQYT